MNTALSLREGKERVNKNIDWGELIQLAGLILISSGLTYEIIFKAALGFILLTAGSLMFAVGTKIRGK